MKREKIIDVFLITQNIFKFPMQIETYPRSSSPDERGEKKEGISMGLEINFDLSKLSPKIVCFHNLRPDLCLALIQIHETPGR